MHKLRFVQINEMHKVLWDFKLRTRRSILTLFRWLIGWLVGFYWISTFTLFRYGQQEGTNFKQVDFVIRSDHWVKLKVNAKMDKYLHFDREQIKNNHRI